MKHQGTWGDGAYILKTGQMLAPQVQSSNEIRIRDGALMVQGALGCVKVNTYDPVTIQNGTQGMKRIDLICWQYTYDAEQDVESAEWVVIQGTPSEADPQQPAYTDGDIQQGDSPVQVPVFAVELDGINVTGVTTLLPTAPTLEELNSKMLPVPITLIPESSNLPSGVSYRCWSYPALGLAFLRIYLPSRASKVYEQGEEYTLYTVPSGDGYPAFSSALYTHGGVNNKVDARVVDGKITITPRLQDVAANNLITIGGFWFTDQNLS